MSGVDCQFVNEIGTNNRAAVVVARKEIVMGIRQEAERPRSGNGTSGLGLRIGSLFSGIGGLELGLEAAGVGRVVYQCEVDAYAREALARNWPGVALYEDVTKLVPGDLPRADVLCGGFPCQDLSVANTRARTGLHGARSGLWAHMARVVEGTRPQWVVVENVAHGWRKWLPSVRRELGQLGYSTLPVQLEAGPLLGGRRRHVRRRVFVLAHADGFQLRLDQQRDPAGRAGPVRDQGQEEPVEPRPIGGWDAEPPLSVVAHGLRPGLAAGTVWRAIGNAVVPQCAEVIGYMIRELVEAGCVATTDCGARQGPRKD
jgi:DNA (cytosine-5)-methyltransferase 1